MNLPVMPPVEPMLARLSRTLPVGRYLYEPKWDGFRCLAFRDGRDVDLRSRHGRPLARYFPELVAGLRKVPTGRFVVDGEIVVAGPDGLDFAALMARLHPAASRVERLATETPGSLVAFDLLAVGDRDLRPRPFGERRTRLERLLSRAVPPVLMTAATTSLEVATRWLDGLQGTGIDGVVAKDLGLAYSPGRRSMVKVKAERTADCVVAGFRLLAEKPAIGSLLLGLYDHGGVLRHIGVASSFTDVRRRELLEELRPFVTGIEGHPWEAGFGLDRSPLGRLHGSAARWAPDEMERDWVPLRPELVCEVAYGQVDLGRFRHPAKFRRWRPDRESRSCILDQLHAGSADLAEAVGP